MSLSLFCLCLQPQHFKSECRQSVAIPLCCASPQRNHYFPLTQVVVIRKRFFVIWFCDFYIFPHNPTTTPPWHKMSWFARYFLLFVFVTFFYCPLATSICHLIQFCPKGNHYFLWNNLSSFARDGFVIWFVTFSFLLTRQPLLPIETICLDYNFLIWFAKWYFFAIFSPTRQSRLPLETICNRNAKTNLPKNGDLGGPPLKDSLLLWSLKKMTKRGSTRFFL